MKILLPVSSDSSFKDALALAIDIAKARDAEILAAYVIDRDELRRIEGGGGFSAIHMAQRAAEEIERRKMTEASDIIRSITESCAQVGVKAQGNIRDGKPAEEFIALAGGCDMVVGAINSHFKPDKEDKPGKMILKIMRDGSTPVLLACSPYRPIHTVVIGCGGKVRTERVVRAMAKMSLWKTAGRGILLAVDDSQEAGEGRLSTSREILSEAGYDPWETRIISGRKHEVFSEYCEKQKADIVVL
ncbi:MAG: universal stress protein, partial [Syntrophorhabdaceae bacterium]|nr:universal stress protein [Syntrophorhabdaceae bacterium]